MILTAVAYLRVSNDLQTQDFSKQEKSINTFCAANGIHLLRVFMEVSGHSPHERPGYKQMLEFLRSNSHVDFVLVHKYKNLSSEAESLFACFIELNDLNILIQPTNLNAYDLRFDTPRQAKWIELN